jgi:hypothetical protein
MLLVYDQQHCVLPGRGPRSRHELRGRLEAPGSLHGPGRGECRCSPCAIASMVMAPPLGLVMVMLVSRGKLVSEHSLTYACRRSVYDQQHCVLPGRGPRSRHELRGRLVSNSDWTPSSRLSNCHQGPGKGQPMIRALRGRESVEGAEVRFHISSFRATRSPCSRRLLTRVVCLVTGRGTSQTRTGHPRRGCQTATKDRGRVSQ